MHGVRAAEGIQGAFRDADVFNFAGSARLVSASLLADCTRGNALDGFGHGADGELCVSSGRVGSFKLGRGKPTSIGTFASGLENHGWSVGYDSR